MSHQSDLIEHDIQAYLTQHENKDMLRFLTCGSVDDGKSTLIGRLLFDSKMIFEDQMAAIEKDSRKFNTTNTDFDLALLVDGLQAEGVSEVLVHYTLAEDIRSLKRVKDAVVAGRPLPQVLREQRVWGLKERLFERVLPQLKTAQLERLLQSAHQRPLPAGRTLGRPVGLGRRGNQTAAQP